MCDRPRFLPQLWQQMPWKRVLHLSPPPAPRCLLASSPTWTWAEPLTGLMGRDQLPHEEQNGWTWKQSNSPKKRAVACQVAIQGGFPGGSEEGSAGGSSLRSFSCPEAVEHFPDAPVPDTALGAGRPGRVWPTPATAPLQALVSSATGPDPRRPSCDTGMGVPLPSHTCGLAVQAGPCALSLSAGFHAYALCSVNFFVCVQNLVLAAFSSLRFPACLASPLLQGPDVFRFCKWDVLLSSSPSQVALFQ